MNRLNQKINRYAYTQTSSLKSLVRLDWEIHLNVKEMLTNAEETGSSLDESIDNDWNEPILR